ncbi:hypothetical protein [Streptomyces aureocirculatus]|uniref:hypothetical protein n=1 Tax=Streptomyces aureocirculatus TaxID=67275 RepID=UPI0012FE9933|nr:hypothetical protein [Streptomyces aureocirculatus]
MSDTSVLRDVADAWHLTVAAGLASPTTALATKTGALLLAVAALAHGHLRPAAALTAVTAAGALAARLLH